MAQAIASFVKSLGDFPLDPDAGQSWLWSGDGAQLLWLSSAAAASLNMGPTTALSAINHGQALESFAIELRNIQPDRQPIRVKQLPLSLGSQSEVYTCLCRHVPLADGGGFGLLTVAIGAPPRLTSAPAPAVAPVAPTATDAQPREIDTLAPQQITQVDTEPTLFADEAAEKISEPALPSVAELLSHVVETAPRPESAPSAPPEPIVAVAPVAPLPPPRRQNRDAVVAPAWTGLAPVGRRPFRFVWQTDGEGRFAHLSRELADAVGPTSATLLGRDWPTVITLLGLTETDDVSAGLASRETWTSRPVFWPVAGTDLGVPVEMAGLPVRENGHFAGFRGYGIVRIEKAITRSGSAANALVDEETTLVENPDDRFGPAVAERLSDAPPREPLMQEQPPREPHLPEPSAAALPESADPFAAAETAAPVTVLSPDMPDRSSGPAIAMSAGLPDDSLLSPSERNAFREIARALGKDAIAASPTPEPRAREIDDEPPPTSPQQMPAWIARRHRARQYPSQDTSQQLPPLPPEASASPTAEPTGAILPFEALQARLDRRSRDPVQAGSPAIIDRLPLAVLVMQQGRAIYANRGFLDLVGHKDMKAFLAVGGTDRFFTAEPSQTPPGPVNTITVRDADGKPFLVDAQVQAITWEDAPAALMTFRKVEAQADARSLERELMAARSEIRELKFVLDTATDGVLSLDETGRILAANRSAEALFGFDQNEIVGEPFTLLLEPESHPAALDYLEGLRTEGVATIMNDGRQVFGRERHGGRIPLFMTLGRMGGGQEVLRFCAVLRDVTIWKKAEAELTDARRAAEDSNANKTDFLARVSHEIRTPMNAIIGFADVMRNETFGPLGNDRYKGYVNDIHSSGLHVVSLVNDLLDLSKVAAGKLDLTFGSVDLNQSVAAAVSMIQPQANAGRVIVRTQLATSLPPVVADERSMRQIVLNLLSNAAKFTEPGGQVIVTTALTERGEAVIRVRDTGIGMTPEELAKAIEPFRQIPGPKSQGGTGLGLPLTKALAEANRAAFAITSEPGKGTLAEVMFPSTRVLAE